MDAVLLAGVTFLLGVATNWVTTRRSLVLQFDTELRRDRLQAYTALWALLEPLNRYGPAPRRLSLVQAERLAADLTSWYFHVGGLYLSVPTRDEYFALQDALEREREAMRRSEGTLTAIEGDRFDSLRVRGSDLRSSLTGDVGTRKQLMVRGRPVERPR
jgi:hypothetical protein